jgi:hypothetical protein
MNNMILANNNSFYKNRNEKYKFLTNIQIFSSLTMVRHRGKPRTIGKASERQMIEAVQLVSKDNFSI